MDQSSARLSIDLNAIAANWRALAVLSPGARAAAVVKADSYGLGAARVAARLYDEGARDFFVALASEGQAIRPYLADDAQIFVLSGHMEGADLAGLIPVLNGPEQYFRDRTKRPGQPFGIQLDTGMNRLGFEPSEWAGLRAEVLAADPALVMSHLACADAPDHQMNRQQLQAFREMTEGVTAPRSLAATGGILLGPEYHFDLTRPGIGLYGGQPFTDAQPVVRLSLPVIQTRLVQTGETVGYSNTWTAERPSRIATVAAGYADGVLRALSSDGQRPRVALFAGDRACPVVGRVSMDLITCDVTGLDDLPPALDLICPAQGVDAVGAAAGTIGYEILTSLAARYAREYL
ncbi:MAG: alanine racemase [Paracoccus sp. (in: a-proteobacteria)]|uniref:alanine racemase n=1 Tax=Paracoccus sp. TaxID=267 RepID=UPI0026DFCB0D|nr:alanine racemase [Paracoccus sp. (in: a-proteobacteria)]MDO5622669.1 alanine racemase [Paracoccus sp. (in: a-proteobacteria)]